MSYDKMLEEAYSQLPSQAFKRERLEVPKPICTISGSRTILHNLGEICNVLRRDQTHVLRFLSREMATAGTVEGSRVIFQGRFEPAALERLIQHYMDVYVICPICKRPDTRIVKEKRLLFLLCEACGAKSPAKPI